MSDRAAIVERFGSTLVVTLNQPLRRNAVNLEMAHKVAEAMDELDNDATLRVGIITGAGEHFCSGMDLKEFAAGRRPVVPGRGFAGLTERPPAKPLIAAVEGAALAGGFEIALSCDLVTAGESAYFGLPEVKRGLIASAGGLLRLPARVPANVASAVALTGELISAQEAKGFGLVNRLVNDGLALEAALGVAEVIAVNGPLAVRATKHALTLGEGRPLAEAFALQSELAHEVRSSAEAHEGALAFIEKRSPTWASTIATPITTTK